MKNVRDLVQELVGVGISSKRFSELDLLGEGPRRMRIGRKIAYQTEDLLEWLESRPIELA